MSGLWSKGRRGKGRVGLCRRSGKGRGGLKE